MLVELIATAAEGRTVYVSFSGGRDSSAVLSAAVLAARRGLIDDPVALTYVYDDVDGGAEETRSQEAVIAHLGVSEWVRLPGDGRRDFLGSVARAGLVRRGLIFPAALQTLDDLFAAAAGGLLLTGEGGDEVLSPTRGWPIALWADPSTRHRASRKKALSTALRRTSPALPERDSVVPWLGPSAWRVFAEGVQRDARSEPLTARRALGWVAGRRVVRVLRESQELVAQEFGVRCIDPLLEPAFLAALAGEAPRWGFHSRTEAMRHLFGPLLPDSLLSRSSKASFNRAFFGHDSRDFVARWDGSGVDRELVDVDVLRTEWLKPSPSAASSMLLQSAWLASARLEGVDP